MSMALAYVAVIIISVGAIAIFGRKILTGQWQSRSDKNRGLIITILGIIAILVSLVSLVIEWLSR